MAKKVLLGMSGGVDSSVSAIILKENGYDVTGITFSLWGNSEKNEKDAKAVCERLNIPHLTLDLKNEFNKHVIQDFIYNYKNEYTPNPCIECNRFIKFGEMYKKAQELGFDYIATGHYAKIEYSEKYGKNVLKKSNSATKDQSYVLYNIPKELLNNIIFPLGEFESKDEIRKIAEKNRLEIANKPDSEDICFIPNGNYKEFLENYADFKAEEGNIVNKDGKVLGKHTGLYKYTIGQRRGLGISNQVPLFVIGFNKEKNELIVGEEKELYKKELIASDVNWLVDHIFANIEKNNDELIVKAKIRYAAKEQRAKLVKLENNSVKVIFEEGQRAITPGQSVVFYDDDIVLGGGKIKK